MIASGTMHKTFEACEERKELRAEVWRPRGRGNNGTTHLYRAALQAHWEAPPGKKKPVQRKAIDALVGHSHAGDTVRDLHCSPAAWEEMKRAVDMLPGVDWPKSAPPLPSGP